MRIFLLSLFAAAMVWGQTSGATDPVLGWECSAWPDNTYYLYCGGALIGHYNTALACVNGRKQVCGPSIGDYECREWPDDTYYLYCGGAYIGHYNTAIECVKGKRSVCD